MKRRGPLSTRAPKPGNLLFAFAEAGLAPSQSKTLHLTRRPRAYDIIVAPMGDPALAGRRFCLTLNVLVRKGVVGFGAVNAQGTAYFDQVQVAASPDWQQVDLYPPAANELGIFVIFNLSQEGESTFDWKTPVVSERPRTRYLVYQHGKLGSHSLHRAIRQAMAKDDGLHTGHFLSNQSFAKTEARRSWKRTPLIEAALQQLTEARAAVSELEADKSARIWILTGVRDPLDFLIASFFQVIEFLCPDFTFQSERISAELPLAEEKFISRVTNNDEELFWFENEFLPFTGVDIYDHPIGDRPFITFTAGRYNVLLYRYEYLRDSFKDILRAVGLPSPEVAAEHNVGSQKRTGALYKAFKESFTAPAALSDHVYRTRYGRFFYPKARPAPKTRSRKMVTVSG